MDLSKFKTLKTPYVLILVGIPMSGKTYFYEHPTITKRVSKPSNKKLSSEKHLAVGKVKKINENQELDHDGHVAKELEKLIKRLMSDLNTSQGEISQTLWYFIRRTLFIPLPGETKADALKVFETLYGQIRDLRK